MASKAARVLASCFDSPSTFRSVPTLIAPAKLITVDHHLAEEGLTAFDLFDIGHVVYLKLGSSAEFVQQSNGILVNLLH